VLVLEDSLVLIGRGFLVCLWDYTPPLQSILK
jgi:hypothetical protein